MESSFTFLDRLASGIAHLPWWGEALTAAFALLIIGAFITVVLER